MFVCMCVSCLCSSFVLFSCVFVVCMCWMCGVCSMIVACGYAFDVFVCKCVSHVGAHLSRYLIVCGCVWLFVVVCGCVFVVCCVWLCVFVVCCVCVLTVTGAEVVVLPLHACHC